MINQVFSIRGATTVNENSVEQITERSVELMSEIVSRNNLTNADFEVTDYIISTTDDITAFYPARAIRESGVINAPVFSAKEPSIDGALPLCIRVMVRVSNSGERVDPKHVYLHNAVNLRKDLIEK